MFHNSFKICFFFFSDIVRIYIHHVYLILRYPLSSRISQLRISVSKICIKDCIKHDKNKINDVLVISNVSKNVRTCV